MGQPHDGKKQRRISVTRLEVGDDDVGRVDADGDGGGVGLLDVDALDVDDPLLAVDLVRQHGRVT